MTLAALLLGVGLLLLLAIPMICATLFSIQDTPGVRPGLTSNDLPLHWWDGGPAYTLASASAVRVNFRGVIAYPANARLRSSLNDRRASGASSRRLIAGWHSVACNLSASALCTADVGRVFPSPRYPLRVSDRSKQLAVDGWNDLSCAASDDKTLTSQMVYDVSACDVLDEGLDILYSHGDVFHKHSSLPQWKYWTLVVLSIILVRFLSYNVQTMWERTEQQNRGEAGRDQRLALVCSLAIVIVIVVDGDSTYVTTADQLFFWCTVAYIGVYLGIHVWLGYLSRRFARLFAPVVVVEPPQDGNEEDDDDRDGAPEAAEADGGGEDNEEDTHPAANGYEQPVYNVIVATLQLVAVRFYSSAETPYNMVLLAMLACRVW
jgi:hypothetical protein